jgi:hypothetical protein
VFINWARINSPDDLKAAMGELAGKLSGGVDAARRGVRSNAETAAAASAKYDDVWNHILERRTGQLSMNAEEQLALRNMWAQSAEKVMELANRATSGATEDLFAFRRMVVVHKMIQDQVLAVRTETARALQQWSIPAGLGGKEKVAAIEAALSRTGGNDTALALAKSIAEIGEETAVNPRNLTKLDDMVQRSWGATTRDIVLETWTGLGLLSGPKTHIRNMVSNTGMMLTNIAERSVASRAGAVNEALGGGPANVKVGEAAAQAIGTVQSLRQAWTDAAEAFRTGQVKTGMGQLDAFHTSAFDALDQNTVAGKALAKIGTAVRVPFKMLTAGDQFFKTLNFNGELSALAYRKAQEAVEAGEVTADAARDMVADLISKPTPDMMRMAQDAADRATFTTEPGKWTKAILDTRNAIPATRWVLPFVNTPANVLKTSLEYTPFAPLMQRYRTAMARGGADAVIANTRLALGIGTMATVTDFVMDGKISGGGPKDAAARAALEATGWQPYSIKVGDRWVSYNGLEPFSTIIGVAADGAEYIADSSGDINDLEQAKDVLAVATLSIANNFLQKSYMRGFADMVDAVVNPQMDGGTVFDRIAAPLLAPAAVAEAARNIDPTVRDARRFMDRVMARVPGLTDNVPAKRDWLGRELSYDSGLGTAYNVLSPFYTKPPRNTPVANELVVLGEGAGLMTRTIRVDGQNVKLDDDPDIFNRRYEIRGQTLPSEMGVEEAQSLIKKYGDDTMENVLNAIVTGNHPLSKKFSATPDTKRRKFIADVISDYSEAANAATVREFPELRERATRQWQIEGRDKERRRERMTAQ